MAGAFLFSFWLGRLVVHGLVWGPPIDQFAASIRTVHLSSRPVVLLDYLASELIGVLTTIRSLCACQVPRSWNGPNGIYDNRKRGEGGVLGGKWRGNKKRGKAILLDIHSRS